MSRQAMENSEQVVIGQEQPDEEGGEDRYTKSVGGRPHSPTDNDRLEKSGRWLLSIPRDDVRALQQTPEYAAFLHAFERLGHAHRKAVVQNRAFLECDEDGWSRDARHPARPERRQPAASSECSYENGVVALDAPTSPRLRAYSFLQHLAVDDVILRVLEFLDCAALVRTCRTCHRFRELAHRCAEQSTHDMSDSRLLGSAMKMLRAKEQMEGVSPNIAPFVRVPMLGLSRRVEVTAAGDHEFCGIYFCTGSNGNGFIFTKPRVPERRVGERSNGAKAARSSRGPEPSTRNNSQTSVNAEGEETQPGTLLRCVIAKRFSNETILWYMSKELNSDDGEVTQSFSYWAKLMVIGDATPDICRYPSQTSILSRNGDPAWHPLSNVRSAIPPIVELLD